jgi:hypothetical protein
MSTTKKSSNFKSKALQRPSVYKYYPAISSFSAQAVICASYLASM